MSLERFHEAQASCSAGYDTALAEIRSGRKTSAAVSPSSSLRGIGTTRGEVIDRQQLIC